MPQARRDGQRAGLMAGGRGHRKAKRRQQVVLLLGHNQHQCDISRQPIYHSQHGFPNPQRPGMKISSSVAFLTVDRLLFSRLFFCLSFSFFTQSKLSLTLHFSFFKWATASYFVFNTESCYVVHTRLKLTGQPRLASNSSNPPPSAS